MEINILNEKENKAINRKEVNFEIVYTQAPPKKVVARKELSKLIKSGENLVLIRKMSNAFGKRKMVCIAHVYPDEKTLKKYEPKYLIERIKITNEENKEEAGEEKKEETGGEEKEEKSEEKAEEPKEEEDKKTGEEVEEDKKTGEEVEEDKKTEEEKKEPSGE